MPLADIVQETQRILDVAEQKNIDLRLFGGMAIRFRCPSATHRLLERKYADIDFMGRRKQSREIKTLFMNLGYTPRDVFNELQGDRRLIFNDRENGRRVDIFLDSFEMCHRLEFKNRLTLDKTTIPLADLLATKLQVVEITEREYRDIIALLHDHEIVDSDASEAINGEYIAQLCANNWGVYKTFSDNLSNISTALPSYQLDPTYQNIVRTRLQDLKNRIENAPKTSRWKARAILGARKRWYEQVEPDKEIVAWQGPAGFEPPPRPPRKPLSLKFTLVILALIILIIVILFLLSRDLEPKSMSFSISRLINASRILNRITLD